MLYSYSYGKNGSQLIRLTFWVVGGSIDGQLFEGRQLENIKNRRPNNNLFYAWMPNYRMECYSLRRYVNCVSPPWKNTTTLPTNIALCELASNSDRKQTLQKTTKWKRKKCKPPVIDFFNSFVVTNRRHCISKLLVLLKVPTPIRTSSTLLIKSFLLSSIAI